MAHWVVFYAAAWAFWFSVWAPCIITSRFRIKKSARSCFNVGPASATPGRHWNSFAVKSAIVRCCAPYCVAACRAVLAAAVRLLLLTAAWHRHRPDFPGCLCVCCEAGIVVVKAMEMLMIRITGLPIHGVPIPPRRKQPGKHKTFVKHLCNVGPTLKTLYRCFINALYLLG